MDFIYWGIILNDFVRTIASMTLLIV